MINASADSIFQNLNNLRNWQKWTVWTFKQDPNMKMDYSGPEAGVGAKQKWESNNFGNGEITIKNSKTPTYLEYELLMDGGTFISTGKLRLESNGSTTKVTWGNYGELGFNPIFRIIVYFFIDDMIGPDFENGLKNLKEIAEMQISPKNYGK